MYIAHAYNAINSDSSFFVIYRIHANAMYIAFRLWGVAVPYTTTYSLVSRVILFF